MTKFTYLIAALFISGYAFAARPSHPPKDPNCAQVYQACQSAGFVVGEYKEGKGLWMDCVNPIMQGRTTAAKATIPLPSVPAQVVEACKQAEPKFGEGRLPK